MLRYLISLLFITFLLPTSIHAHGATGLVLLISFLPIVFIVYLAKIYILRQFEQTTIKKQSFKLLFLSLIIEVFIFFILRIETTGGYTWDNTKFVLYIYFILANIINYMILLFITKRKINAMIYSLFFTILTVGIYWTATIQIVKCSDYPGFHKCNFFVPPDLEILEFFDVNLWVKFMKSRI